MCGRFAAPRNAEDILGELELEWDEFTPEKEVFPTNQVLVGFSADGLAQAAEMTWGWQRNFSKRPLINVRGPEAWKKPTWSDAIQSRRCIVPASSCYEWDQNQPKGKRDRYRIQMRHAQDFAMGGLYEVDEDSGEFFVSILTTAPNKTMRAVHHRMPVIVENSELSSWLTSQERDVVDRLMLPALDEDTTLIRD